MIPIIISSVAGFISFVILDYIWLAIVAKDFYLKSLAAHITLKDGALVPYLPAIPLVYIVAILGIWVFVISRVQNLTEACLYGALLGFCMYAFYDFTNIATLKDYPWSLTLLDIAWGTFLVTLVSGVMFFVKDLVG